MLDAIEAHGYNTLDAPPLDRHGRTRCACWARALVLRGSRSAPTRPPPAFASRLPRPGISLSRRDGCVRVARTQARARSAVAVARSYAECRRVARDAASNFYYAFYMLPRPKRDALCALYAFMRLVDDVSDSARRGSPRAPTSELAAPRRKSAALPAGARCWTKPSPATSPAHPILPAFADTIRRYRIPPRYFHDLISGAEMDLTETRYATFDRLREYCYRVAGTVGPHLPARLWFRRSSRAGTGRTARHRLSADQYSPRRRQRSGRWAASILPAEDLDALRLLGRRTCARRSHPVRCANCLRFEARTRLAILSPRAAGLIPLRASRQPRRALGADAHLQHACSRASKSAISMCSPRACV